jgi:hypothetical protein
MIKISAQDLFIAYISFTFIGIFMLWIRELMRRKEFEWRVSEAALCVCGKCHYAFLVKAGEKLANCPRCKDLCVVKKIRR